MHVLFLLLVFNYFCSQIKGKYFISVGIISLIYSITPLVSFIYREMPYILSNIKWGVHLPL